MPLHPRAAVAVVVAAFLGTLLVATPAAAVAHETSGRHVARHNLRRAPEVEDADVEEQEDDAADDEDDDDTDDSDEGTKEVSITAAKAPAATANVVAAAKAPQDAGTQAEKARLEAAVRAAHDALKDNLQKQVEVNVEMKDLDDEKRLNAQVDTQVQAVANETQSSAMANFLGDMWKEMRSFAKPFYKEHLEEKLANLEAKNKVLQTRFGESQANLTAWSQKIEVMS